MHLIVHNRSHALDSDVAVVARVTEVQLRLERF